MNINYNIDKLNIDEEKKVAVRTTEGPLLIIAGPGAGKTKTLVERIIYLISKGVLPEEIFVATFTEKAAKELISRISNKLLSLGLDINLNEMYIGTLHSIFLRILDDNREHTRLKRSYRMLDQFDQRYFLYNNIRPYLDIDGATDVLGAHTVSSWYKAEKLIKYLNVVGEENLDTKILKESEVEEIRCIGEFYDIYCQQLEEENALDFSFIQSEVYHLLTNSETVLASLQSKLKYFMVDEYQDTNTIQEKIILKLSSKNQNICVVGDDDQGLYRFRGATIRNILEFENNFEPGKCKKVVLNTNYRSHPQIIDFYNKWMDELDWTDDGKQFRYNKTIKPRKDIFPKTASVIRVSNNGTALDYHNEVLGFIQGLQASGKLTDLNQIAFLFKSVKNNKVIGLAEFLEENGIKVFSPRSALFFDRHEVKLLVGAIVFIFPDLFELLKWSDNADLEIWKYYDSCKRYFAAELRQDLDKHNNLLKWCQMRSKQHLTLTEGTNYGFAALVYQLLEYPMFSEYMDTSLDSNKADLRPPYNIALFTKLLWKFEYLNNVTVITPENKEKVLRNLFNFFIRFIYDGGIEEYEDFDENTPSGCVSFMTIHQSKGLEFPITVVGMPNNRQGPRTQYSDIDALLQKDYYHKPPFEPLEQTKFYDFWRLYYTAFSRAQNVLVLSCQEQQNKTGKYSAPHSSIQPIYFDVPKQSEGAFDLKQIELEEVKPSSIKHEYSFTSHILLYENCPLQYKFYKELEFTEVRTGGVLGGTLLHQTIEDIHKAVLKKRAETLTDDNIESWFNTNYYLLSKQQKSYLHLPQRVALLKQILNYRDRNNGSWDKIVAAEVDVSLVKEDYILKGSIDLIKGENGTVDLIDFKSGSKPDVNALDKRTRAVLDRYRRQLEIYAHLVEQRTGHTVSQMHLHYPKEQNGSPYITFKKNDTKIEKTMASFDGVVTKIENKNFDSSHIERNDKQCGECDMRFYCNPSTY